MLWYKAPARIHIALLRGTSADLDGNISYEHEPLLLDNLNQVCSACSACCAGHAARACSIIGLLLFLMYGPFSL